MSKVIQISVCGIDNNSTTQSNYVTTILTDDGRIFETMDTTTDWRELNLPKEVANDDKQVSNNT